MSSTLASDVLPYLSRERQAAPPPGKKGKSLTSFILPLLILVLVGLGVMRTFNKPAAPETVKVVGVAQDLPPGCRLGFHHLHYVQIPKQYHRETMFESYEQVIGKVTRTFIATGEPITSSTLFQSAAGLAKQVLAPERAVTLKLAGDAILDNNLYPGDRVDIVATTAGKEGRKYTRTICQNIRVLMCTPKEAALSAKVRSEELEKITLAFMPEDAEKVIEANECGKLRLVLRSPNNNQGKLQLRGSDERDLIPYEGPRSVATPAAITAPPMPTAAYPVPALPTTTGLMPAADPVGWLVEIFSGNKKETQTFTHQQ